MSDLELAQEFTSQLPPANVAPSRGALKYNDTMDEDADTDFVSAFRVGRIFTATGQPFENEHLLQSGEFHPLGPAETETDNRTRLCSSKQLITTRGNVLEQIMNAEQVLLAGLSPLQVPTASGHTAPRQTTQAATGLHDSRPVYSDCFDGILGAEIVSAIAAISATLPTVLSKAGARAKAATALTQSLLRLEPGESSKTSVNLAQFCIKGDWGKKDFTEGILDELIMPSTCTESSPKRDSSGIWSNDDGDRDVSILQSDMESRNVYLPRNPSGAGLVRLATTPRPTPGNGPIPLQVRKAGASWKLMEAHTSGVKVKLDDVNLPHIRKNPYQIAPRLPERGHGPSLTSPSGTTFDPVPDLGKLDGPEQGPIMLHQLQSIRKRSVDSSSKGFAPAGLLREGLHLATRQQVIGGSISSADLRRCCEEGLPPAMKTKAQWTRFPSIDLSIKRPRWTHSWLLEESLRQSPGNSREPRHHQVGSDDRNDAETVTESMLAIYMVSDATATAAPAPGKVPSSSGWGGVGPLSPLWEPFDGEQLEIQAQAAPTSHKSISPALPTDNPSQREPSRDQDRSKAGSSDTKGPGGSALEPAPPTPAAGLPDVGTKEDGSATRSIKLMDARPLPALRTPIRHSRGRSETSSHHGSVVSSTSRRSVRSRSTSRSRHLQAADHVAVYQAGHRQDSALILPSVRRGSPTSELRRSAAPRSVSSTSSSKRPSVGCSPAQLVARPNSLPKYTRLVLVAPSLQDAVTEGAIEGSSGTIHVTVSTRGALSLAQGLVSVIEIDRNTVVLVVDGSAFDPEQRKTQGAKVLGAVAESMRCYQNISVISLLVGPHVEKLNDTFNSLTAMIGAADSTSIKSFFCFTREHLQAHVHAAVRSSVVQSVHAAAHEADEEAADALLNHTDWKNGREGTWERFFSSLPGSGPSAAQEVLTGIRGDSEEVMFLGRCIADLQHANLEDVLLQEQRVAGREPSFARAVSFLASKEPVSEYDSLLEEATADLREAAISADSQPKRVSRASGKVRRHQSSLDASSFAFAVHPTQTSTQWSQGIPRRGLPPAADASLYARQSDQGSSPPPNQMQACVPRIFSPMGAFQPAFTSGASSRTDFHDGSQVTPRGMPVVEGGQRDAGKTRLDMVHHKSQMASSHGSPPHAMGIQIPMQPGIRTSPTETALVHRAQGVAHAPKSQGERLGHHSPLQPEQHSPIDQSEEQQVYTRPSQYTRPTVPGDRSLHQRQQHGPSESTSVVHQVEPIPRSQLRPPSRTGLGSILRGDFRQHTLRSPSRHRLLGGSAHVRARASIPGSSPQPPPAKPSPGMQALSRARQLSQKRIGSALGALRPQSAARGSARGKGRCSIAPKAPPVAQLGQRFGVVRNSSTPASTSVTPEPLQSSGDYSMLSQVQTPDGLATPEQAASLRSRRLVLGGRGVGGQTRLTWSEKSQGRHHLS